MKFIECPHCKEDAVKIWYLFVGFSPFWISRLCRHCNKRISFNWFFIKIWMGSILFGMISGNRIDRIFNIQSDLFGAVYMIFFFIFPAIIKIPLFSIRH
jgi:hypothetical protein